MLLMAKGLGAGGTEHLLVQSLRHRDHTGVRYRVAYLLAHKTALRPAVEAEGVEATCLGGRPWWHPGWMVRLRRTLRSAPVHIVHAHSPLVAAGARLVTRTLPRAVRPAVVTTTHNVWSSHHRATRALERATAPLDAGRYAVSDAVRRSIPGRAGRRTTTLVHGIDIAQVTDAADRDAVRNELGVDPQQILVGTVANLRATKGYPDLLTAAAALATTHPQVVFVAAGQGPLRDDLERRRAELDLASFRFLGHRTDTHRLLSGLDVFCLPSRHEGLPLALMEALAAGLPVVATDVGGVGELVTHDRESILVPPARPDRLAEAIARLAEDPDRRMALGAAATRTAQQLSAVDAVAAVEVAYRRLIAP